MTRFFSSRRLVTMIGHPSPKHSSKPELYEPDWEELMTLPMAMAHEIAYGFGGNKQSLRWVGENNPARLDWMLDRADPNEDPRLFYALVLVCEHYANQIADSVNARNERIKKTIRSQVDRPHLKDTRPYLIETRPYLRDDYEEMVQD